MICFVMPFGIILQDYGFTFTPKYITFTSKGKHGDKSTTLRNLNFSRPC